MLISRVSPEGDAVVGEVDLRVWDRLRAALLELRDVQLRLTLSRRGQVVLAEGELQILGRVLCERCLGAMPLSLRVPLRVGIGESEAAVAAVDAELDPVAAANGILDLQTWLEDEALLALPMVPRCEVWVEGPCSVSNTVPPQATN
ncbi:MAG: YceD family protein [Acidithiobacillus sp.]|uniref:YceD family protein n=1 Tax=Acidithiobacillus sp. TaxID=1872118 RepID=UPI003CFF03F9